MAIEDYFTNFDGTIFTVDNTDWSSAYFLRLKDDKTGARPGVYTWCGKDCIRHTLHLKSSIEQKVYIKAHSWPNRFSAESCIDKGATHSLYISGHGSKVYTFKEGSSGAYPV